MGRVQGRPQYAERFLPAAACPSTIWDAHIYGTYHSRFTRQRHPVNDAWSTSPNGLAWLLALSWESFENFNRAALPEYLDLLAEDMARSEHDGGLIVDGGISNPALLAQIVPASRVVCLARSEPGPTSIWEGDGERREMKEAILRLDDPEEAWRTFLAFDQGISRSILKECRDSGIQICWRTDETTVEQFAAQVGSALGIQ